MLDVGRCGLAVGGSVNPDLASDGEPDHRPMPSRLTEACGGIGAGQPPGSLGAVFEAPAFVAGFDDVAMVSEAVE